jgi:hypothetical protein
MYELVGRLSAADKTTLVPAAAAISFYRRNELGSQSVCARADKTAVCKTIVFLCAFQQKVATTQSGEIIHMGAAESLPYSRGLVIMSIHPNSTSSLQILSSSDFRPSAQSECPIVRFISFLTCQGNFRSRSSSCQLPRKVARLSAISLMHSQTPNPLSI